MQGGESVMNVPQALLTESLLSPNLRGMLMQVK
ncbi:hypothetical protein EMIT0111MI5_140181 [Burkholderia sp. IT-111MI5]